MMMLLTILGEVVLILGVYAALAFLSAFMTMVSLTASERAIARLEARRRRKQEEQVVKMHQNEESKESAYA